MLLMLLMAALPGKNHTSLGIFHIDPTRRYGWVGPHYHHTLLNYAHLFECTSPYFSLNDGGRDRRMEGGWEGGKMGEGEGGCDLCKLVGCCSKSGVSCLNSNNISVFLCFQALSITRQVQHSIAVGVLMVAVVNKDAVYACAVGFKALPHSSHSYPLSPILHTHYPI